MAFHLNCKGHRALSSGAATITDGQYFDLRIGFDTGVVRSRASTSLWSDVLDPRGQTTACPQTTAGRKR